MKTKSLLSLTMSLGRDNTSQLKCYKGNKSLFLFGGNAYFDREVIRRAHQFRCTMQHHFSDVSNNEGYVIGLHHVFQGAVKGSNFTTFDYYVRNFEEEDQFVRYFILHTESGYDRSIDKNF